MRGPGGVGLGADEREEMADRAAMLLAGVQVAAVHGAELAVLTIQLNDLAAGQHLDIGRAPDAVDQVARHAGVQAFAVHHHPYLGDLAG